MTEGSDIPNVEVYTEPKRQPTSVFRRRFAVLPSIVYISGLVIVAATAFLAYDNRGSAEILKAASAIVGGVIISLVTMLLFFKDEESSTTLAIDLLVESESGIPVDLANPFATIRRQFPDSTKLLERQVNIQRAAREIAARDPRFASLYVRPPPPNTEKQQFPYVDLVTLQIISAMSDRFSKGWSAEFEPHEYKVLGDDTRHWNSSTTQGISKEQQTTIEAPALATLFERTAFRNGIANDALNMPPRTQLNISLQTFFNEIIISNSFLEFRIRIGPSFIEEIDKQSSTLEKLSLEKTIPHSVVVMEIELKKTLKATKRGNPAMETYRRWADELTKTISLQFDDQEFWSKLNSTNIQSTAYAPWGEQKKRWPVSSATRTVISQYKLQVAYKYQLHGLLRDEVGEIVLRLATQGFDCEELREWEKAQELKPEDGPEFEEAQAFLSKIESNLTPAPVILVLLPNLDTEEARIVRGLISETLSTYLPNYAIPPKISFTTFANLFSDFPVGDGRTYLLSLTSEKVVWIVIS